MSIHGSGFQKNNFITLRRLFDHLASKPSDYDCILSWDATGYKKKLKFDKNSGKLIGFGCHPERFTMHHAFSNCVNCFMVTSPELHMTIKYPVAYYHCSSLNSKNIRRQFEEVMTGLDSVGLRVVSTVCDTASEHVRFFNKTLDTSAASDPDIKVRLGDLWSVSDPPHLIKKFRNNWISSGEHENCTRRLCKNGNLITWKVMKAVYTVATTGADGHRRPLNLLRKFTWDVVSPISIQRLRVSLAAIPFSKQVRDFINDNLDRLVEVSGLRVNDILCTLEFMSMVDELFQIMNSTFPITWTDTDDGTGTPIGLRDKVDTSRGHSLTKISSIYGVSVQHLMDITGLPSPETVSISDTISN